MNRILPFVFLICLSASVQSQITNPAIRANFGVDADLRANYYDGFVQAGNDDWFNNGTAGPGTFIIDTTGAAFINKMYITKPVTRLSPFFREMRYPQFSIVNNMMLIDAIFIRDHHGDDSTVFASGSNKNGMSPADWSCPVSQGIPDKNDILDMMLHVRRAGPNAVDSLWMFAGLSLDNTTGNRYFDFEMYQTDIVYNRPTLSFTGYGPDAGHTSWVFDAAGNVLQAGDIIFTAEYSSSDLSMVEARIWVSQTTRSTVTPASFNWGGPIDGASAGATYGYAVIVPKTAGNFYTGLQCGNNTWGGPFGIVLQDNSLAVNYGARQYMEFSVNLSKLGLDPLVNMGDACKMPFRRILVKSRASTSFTAELKDFVGPFSFFRGPALEAEADSPTMCGSFDTRTITIPNALETSLYTWSTTDGSIVGDNTGPEITVNSPGTYVVSQQLMDSCGSTWARDSVVIGLDPTCTVLTTKLLSFNAGLNRDMVSLDWNVGNNKDALYFQLERSLDNSTYISVNKQFSTTEEGNANYTYTDNIKGLNSSLIFYRLKVVERNGHTFYSRIIAVNPDKQLAGGFKVMPNPVKTQFALLVTSDRSQQARITIFDAAGKQVESLNMAVSKGTTLLPLNNPASRLPGVYVIHMALDGKTYSEKMIYTK
jgi:hypothetical protein